MKTRVLAVLFFLFAFIIALHQFLVWGEWFTFSQLHHETFVIAFGFAGFVLILLDRRRKK